MTVVSRETCPRCRVPTRAGEPCRLCWLGEDERNAVFRRQTLEHGATTEPCDGRCTRCDGEGQIDDLVDRPFRDCPCVAAQRLPDLWRPLMVEWEVEGEFRAIAYDREDQPRLLHDVEDAPDVPAWWMCALVQHHFDHLNDLANGAAS